jgi:hypothetical protein
MVFFENTLQQFFPIDLFLMLFNLSYQRFTEETQSGILSQLVTGLLVFGIGK